MARRKRGRRRYRRNPGMGRAFSVGGLTAKLKRGLIDALWVVGGEAGAGMVPALAGLKADGTPRLPTTGVAGFAVTGISAIAIGELVRRFAKNSRAAEFAVAGALAKPLKVLVKSFNIAKVNQALSAYPSYDGYSFDGYPPRTNVDTAGHLNGIPGAFATAGFESGSADVQGL